MARYDLCTSEHLSALYIDGKLYVLAEKFSVLEFMLLAQQFPITEFEARDVEEGTIGEDGFPDRIEDVYFRLKT